MPGVYTCQSVIDFIKRVCLGCSRERNQAVSPCLNLNASRPVFLSGNIVCNQVLRASNRTTGSSTHTHTHTNPLVFSYFVFDDRRKEKITLPEIQGDMHAFMPFSIFNYGSSLSSLSN